MLMEPSGKSCFMVITSHRAAPGQQNYIESETKVKLYRRRTGKKVNEIFLGFALMLKMVLRFLSCVMHATSCLRCNPGKIKRGRRDGLTTFGKCCRENQAHYVRKMLTLSGQIKYVRESGHTPASRNSQRARFAAAALIAPRLGLRPAGRGRARPAPRSLTASVPSRSAK
jgi:hypothetical protein